MSTECSICCSNFNKSTLKEIKCESCNEKVCKQCVMHWLKERTNITCPCCNVVWDTHFCYENVSKKISDDYRQIHTDLIFKIEQTYIAETQPFIQIEKMYEQARKELKETIDHRVMCNSVPIVKQHRRPNTPTWKNDERTKEIAKTYRKIVYINILDEQISALRFRANKLSECLMDHHDIEILNEHLQSNLYVKKENKSSLPCPANDCKGYIFTYTGKCGLCDIHICRKCHVIVKDENHVCNQDDIETVKLIYDESKPCPKCNARISKIDGCDQMYCVQCKTAFSWRTGKVETGRIHNPHYYDELRRINNGVIPREPGDNPNIDDDCVEPVRAFRLIRDNSETFLKFMNLYNSLYSDYNYTNATLMRYTGIDENINFNTNFKNRFKYIKNEIDEDKFKSMIYRDFKNTKYNKEIYGLVREFLDIFKRILKNMYLKLIPSLDVNTFKELFGLFCKIRNTFAKRYQNINSYYGYKKLNDFFTLTHEDLYNITDIE